MFNPLTLAIIGAGPSCTYVLDRLAARIREAPVNLALEIHIFERSGQFGAGAVHSPDQPVTSFLNRIVGQVAFAADESVVGAGPLLAPHERPTLLEWCRQRYAVTGDSAFHLSAEDWPKRYVHGLALRDQFERYIDILCRHPGLQVHLHSEEAIDLVDTGCGLGVINTAQCQVVVADHVLLLTGHSANDPTRFPISASWTDFAARNALTYVPSAYPLETAIDARTTGNDSVVALAGSGLTAIDVILHLTEGRGGEFVNTETGLQYRPSGAEPSAILVFSRSGMFTFARPFNAKEADPSALQHHGVFFTHDTVERLRAARGQEVYVSGSIRRQLDFESHVLPVVVLEMAVLYYRTLFGDEFADLLVAAAWPRCNEFIDGAGSQTSTDPSQLLVEVDRIVHRAADLLDAVLAGQTEFDSDLPLSAMLGRYLRVVFGLPRGDELNALLDRPSLFAAEIAASESPWRHPARASESFFSWQKAIRPISGDVADFHHALLDFMEVDHRWAAQNNLWNPAKAAADGVWRDCRETLAEVVDFGGLTAASHQQFLEVYMRHHNRLCGGAALEVMDKIKALMEIRLVDLSVGPGGYLDLDGLDGIFTIRGPVTGVSRSAEAVIDCRVHPFDAENDTAPLYRNLLRRGLIRKWINPAPGGVGYAPGGLDLTDHFHPCNTGGCVDTRMTLLGPPSEGVMFFQLGALRPNQNHHVMQDILRWINEFWPQCLAKSRRKPADDEIETA